MRPRTDSMDRPVRRASSKAESDMAADYTCVAARVVLCLESRGPDRQRKSGAGHRLALLHRSQGRLEQPNSPVDVARRSGSVNDWSPLDDFLWSVESLPRRFRCQGRAVPGAGPDTVAPTRHLSQRGRHPVKSEAGRPKSWAAFNVDMRRRARW
jgi:hypothetical protein